MNRGVKRLSIAVALSICSLTACDGSGDGLFQDGCQWAVADLPSRSYLEMQSVQDGHVLYLQRGVDGGRHTVSIWESNTFSAEYIPFTLSGIEIVLDLRTGTSITLAGQVELTQRYVPVARFCEEQWSATTVNL